MKKITTVADLGGAPIFKNDLRTIFGTELWDVIQGFMTPFDNDTEGVVISGCVVTANVGTPANFDMTAGIFYCNGEFFRIGAQANQTFTKYMANFAPTPAFRTFQDGTSHEVIIDKEGTFFGSTPGGQYLKIASLTDLDDRRWSTLLIKGGITKAWANIPLANGWAVANFATPQWRINPFGAVQFRGQLDGTSASSNLITATGIFPSVGYNASVATNRLHVSTLAIDASFIAIETNGRLSSGDHANSVTLYLDGLEYYVW